MMKFLMLKVLKNIKTEKIENLFFYNVFKR